MTHGESLYVRSTTLEGIAFRLACSKKTCTSEENNPSPFGASSSACRREATAVLMPRDRTGHQGATLRTDASVVLS
jgi:hypothetical protein